MQPRHVRRQDQHAPKRPALAQLPEQRLHVLFAACFVDDGLPGAFVEEFHDALPHETLAVFT
jgi:hypothetical protein